MEDSSSIAAARLYERSEAERFAYTREEFSRLLAECAPAPATVSDLVLARACARGNDAAWECFVGRYREKLYAAARAMTHDAAAGRELADSLYADLYGTRREEGRPAGKLASYMGRGSLEGWLKAILAQEYVNRLRQGRKLAAYDDALQVPAEDSTADPVQRTVVAAATDKALDTLDDEERFLLAAYYLDERTLAEIGRMLAMHESTVSRRLDKLTARLRKSIVKLLCAGGTTKRAAEEMLKLDVRDLGARVSEKLVQERRA